LKKNNEPILKENPEIEDLLIVHPE